MIRTFQIVAYHKPALGEGGELSSKSTEMKMWRSLSVRIEPKRPTFVSGATARAAGEPACTKFGVHYSDLEIKLWNTENGQAFPANAEHLTPPPAPSVANMGNDRDIEREMKRLRDESYAKLRPKKRRRR